ncbi:MAG TPA: VWA domain-containing protein [Anaerolineales bacterium]|nr:VWA domain-containing protein [Anaerolineales bacterium]
MYSEKSRVPLGALITAGAAILFGCIVAAVFIFRGVFGDSVTGQTAGDATPEAPAGSVVVDISSSNTKENWMDELVSRFNAEAHETSDGNVIFVRVAHVTSGGSQLAILDGASQPQVWSPGDQSWVDGANTVWRDRTGRPLVTEACPLTVLAPSGFAMWRPMAEALGWPDTPISWDDLVDLAANPDGWISLGHPEWGTFKFGHVHPTYSNVGLQMMTALVYSTVGETAGLTPEMVYSDPVVEAFTKVELNTWHYGIQSRNLIERMIVRGPNYLHAVTTSEAEMLKTNEERAGELRFPLAFIFPAEGTFWSEHPYCILDADWVSDEQGEAARIFLDYMLARPQQELAIDNFLRPIDETIPLHSPLALADGTDPRVTTAVVPPLESPSAEAAEAVKDVFFLTKKKATVILLLDTSGSMEGDKIKEAVESSVNFVERLDPNDEIYIMTFGGDIIKLSQGGRAGVVAEALAVTLRGLFADGNTPLYDAVCDANDYMNDLKAEHDAAGERRLYGIVLLSDGDDTSSNRTENQMFGCLPSGEDVEGIKIFTIAYGEDADTDLMLRIANRTNGLSFTASPASIDRIYNSISAEQ